MRYPRRSLHNLWDAVKAMLLFSVAACAPGGEVSDRKAMKVLAALDAMNGKSGEFEGVYRPGLREGSSFEFCSRDECPDMREHACEPVFNETSEPVLGKFWIEHDGEPIYMFVSGVIRTGSRYGHMGQHLCEITISDVRWPKLLKSPALLVRSKKYPGLAMSPN